MMDTSLSGHLLTTDYWQHPEGAAGGFPWLKAERPHWHLVLPDTPVCSWPDHPNHRATMLPVVDAEEPGGWTWLLLVRICQTERQAQPIRSRISPRAILGAVPPLPPADYRKRVRLVIYRSSKEVLHGVDERWEKAPMVHTRALSCWLDVVRPKKDGRFWLRGRPWPRRQ